MQHALMLVKYNKMHVNAHGCTRMHKNAYGKKQHHFWEKTTPDPAAKAPAKAGKAAANVPKSPKRVSSRGRK
jgi:hypothetical protein